VILIFRFECVVVVVVSFVLYKLFAIDYDDPILLIISKLLVSLDAALPSVVFIGFL
jgi:hypothetical protein